MSVYLTEDALSRLKRDLDEAKRTVIAGTGTAAERYVAFPGAGVENLLGKQHHLVSGRRGTGKSTLLDVARAACDERGIPNLAIDVEGYKHLAYPDILLRILVDIVEVMRPKISFRTLHRAPPIRVRARKLARALNAELLKPPQLTHSYGETAFRSSQAEFGVDGVAGVPDTPIPATGQVRGHWRIRRGSGNAVGSSGVYGSDKYQRVAQLLPSIRELLKDLASMSPAGFGIIFVDDFYFVALDEQAKVLDYLQAATKGTQVWLKVCGVSSRLSPYKAGNPSIGMQRGQDIHELRIDIALDDFATAKTFLEQVISPILAASDVKTEDLLTDLARIRMVLACGGAIPRDYITLLGMALDVSWKSARANQTTKNAQSVPVRIEATDVQKAIGKLLDNKLEDVVPDAGRDAQSVRDRWRDITDFARAKSTSFILVRQDAFDREEWADEVRNLEDLRMLHKIGTTTPNTPRLAGTQVTRYMLDLASMADERFAKGAIPEFWRGTRELDKLRKSSWLYEPTWRK